MKTLVKIEVVDGKDYVSLTDAKRILGAKSAGDLKALGSSTITVGAKKVLWSLGWIIDQAKRIKNSDKYSPDMEWIENYVLRLEHARTAQQKKASPPVAPKTPTSSGEVSRYLDYLLKLLPPPKDVPSKDVDWPAVEHLIGVKYPLSFKRFIAVYGSLQWFDWLQPLVPFENMTPKAFGNYVHNIFRDYLSGEISDTNGRAIAVPKLRSKGAWLPFMTGNDGEVYAWSTIGPSERWNVICVINRHATILPPLSLPEMIAEWLQGEQTMQPLWGDVDEFRKQSPERLKMLR